MVRISRIKLKNNVLDKLFRLFFEIVGRKNNYGDFNNTICDLLSSTERIMIAKRIAIIYLLMKEIDHRTICDVLKVSTATIAKFNFLMEKSTGIVPTFNKILRDEKITDFLADIFITLYHPGLPRTNWKSAWQLKNEVERKKIEGI